MAAKSITQRITLAGAEAIRAQLAGIGAAGSKAWDQLGQIRNVNGQLAAAGTSLAKLGNDLKDFGNKAKAAGEAGVAFGNSVGAALLKVTGLTAGLGVAASKLVGAFEKVGGEQEELQQNADAANLTTQAYQNLTNALGVNGVGQEEAGKALDKVSKFIRDGAKQLDDYNTKLKALNKGALKDGTFGTQAYRDALQALNESRGDALELADRYNVKLKDEKGNLRNVRDVSIDIGVGMKDADDKTRAAADALTVFGKAGRKIGQAFAQGREEIQKLELESARLAPALSDSAKAAVTGMDDNFDRLNQTTKSLKTQLLSIFAPQVSTLVHTLTDTIANNRQKFIDFATTLKAQVQPAIDEVLKLLNSKDAGDVLVAVFKAMTDAAKAVGTAIKDFIIPSFVALYAAASSVATFLNGIFGTQLTGGIVLAGVALAKFTGLFTVLGAGITLVTSLFSALFALGPAIAALGAFILTPVGALALLAVAVGGLVTLILVKFPLVGQAILLAFTSPLEFIKAALTGIGNAAFAAINYILGLFGVQDPFAAQKAFRAVMQAAQDAWTYVVDSVRAVPGNIGIIWKTLTGYFDQVWADIKKGVGDLWTYVTDKFNSMIQKVKDYLFAKSKADDSGGGDGATPAYAGGGRVRGGGTSTSDSILARLSNGEFVVKARAVAHYGAGFFSRLNQMRLPKFASGGFVQAVQSVLPDIPRFARGGLAGVGGGGDMRPFTLQIGDQAFSGLRAPSSTIDDLTRYASGKQLASAGRRPNWYRG